jgi:hypothetical protein
MSDNVKKFLELEQVMISTMKEMAQLEDVMTDEELTELDNNPTEDCSCCAHSAECGKNN